MHYAKVENNIVTQVIVAEADFFDTFVDTSAGEWIQTSYNTSGGVHSNGDTPLRMNFASVGGAYDKVRDVFIPLKPFPSWTLVEATCQWEAPIAYPSDGEIYEWNESTTSWVLDNTGGI